MKTNKICIVIFFQIMVMAGLVSVSVADKAKTFKSQPKYGWLKTIKGIANFSNGEVWILSVEGVMGSMAPLKKRKMEYVGKWRGQKVTFSTKSMTKKPIVMFIQTTDEIRLKCDGFYLGNNKNIIGGFCRDRKEEETSWFAYRKTPQVVAPQQPKKPRPVNLDSIERMTVPGGVTKKTCARCENIHDKTFPKSPSFKRNKDFMKLLNTHHDNLLGVIKLAFPGSAIRRFDEIERAKCPSNAMICRVMVREETIRLIVENQR